MSQGGASAPTRQPSMFIASIVASAFFMENLDQTVVVTAIPEIARSLGEPPLQLRLIVTSYLLSLAVFMPISGWIADRFGARTVFCAALGIFTVGSALSGLSDSLPLMIATRILQGFGGAMMTPIGRLIILRTFPRDRLVTAMMYMSIPAMIGPTLGPIIGGFLATYVSWRWIFYVNIPIGVIGIILAWRFIDDYREPVRTRFDVLGFVMVGLGLATLQLALETLARPIGPAAMPGILFAIAVVLLGFYVRHAYRVENPAVDLKVLRIRTFRIGALSGSVCRIGMNASPFLLPLLFQLGFGMTPMESGLLTFASTLGAMMMRLPARFLLRTLGFRRLLIGNAVLAAAITAAFALQRVDTPYWIALGHILVLGFARSTQFLCLNTLSYADVPPGLTSRATSIGALAQQLSISFGVAIAASLLALVVGYHQHEIAAEDFQPVFAFAGLIILVSLVGFLRLTPTDGTEVSGYKPKG